MIPTGLLVDDSPIGLSGAAVNFLIALTALIWTIVQEIRNRKQEKNNLWIQAAIDTLFKRYKEPTNTENKTENKAEIAVFEPKS